MGPPDVPAGPVSQSTGSDRGTARGELAHKNVRPAIGGARIPNGLSVQRIR
jgi:hypothetical protein